MTARLRNDFDNVMTKRTCTVDTEIQVHISHVIHN